jgi:hypothetical protein
MGKKKRKPRRRFCCDCGGVVEPEVCSGIARQLQICKKCRAQGGADRAFQRAEQALFECCDYDGIIFRKRRNSFNQFLNHPNSMIRLLAQAMLEDDFKTKADLAEMEAESEGSEETELRYFSRYNGGDVDEYCIDKEWL